LLIALTLHSLLDSFYPNALAFFNPYVILVIYYSMGGNIAGAIAAGVLAGFVQDAFSNAMFGLHAFSLTVCGYVVASINAQPRARARSHSARASPARSSSTSS
jgi:rod shape-determining protein MreD